MQSLTCRYQRYVVEFKEGLVLNAFGIRLASQLLFYQASPITQSINHENPRGAP